MLQRHNLKRSEQVLSFYDPVFLLKEPAARPLEIAAMDGLTVWMKASRLFVGLFQMARL
jgi:hypothetical protein